VGVPDVAEVQSRKRFEGLKGGSGPTRIDELARVTCVRRAGQEKAEKKPLKGEPWQSMGGPSWPKALGIAKGG